MPAAFARRPGAAGRAWFVGAGRRCAGAAKARRWRLSGRAVRCGYVFCRTFFVFTHRVILRKMALSHAVPTWFRAVPSGLGWA
ncbi:hypothetical protein DM56_4171 [Burkholderia mallei]|nr:hypothetical protein DO64_5630 [Burkholderia pseudomallei]KGX47129.1 hypothetical protein Y600_5339 [Burkholderia pseudomallei MSHR3709]KOS78964.1 hypothetical protein DM53_3897 [Burkholderia mallei]KGC37912.1 hypothetical protein DO73_3698 [Burkholderia pseudomallei]KGD12872.1 hypothetical protein DP42_3349 [Burkholderia pseudomallei]